MCPDNCQITGSSIVSPPSQPPSQEPPRLYRVEQIHAAAYDLNEAARKNIGLVNREQVSIRVQDNNKRDQGERLFAVGDRIIGGRNNRKTDIQNGEMGTITEIRQLEDDDALIEIQKDDGNKLRSPRMNIARWIMDAL